MCRAIIIDGDAFETIGSLSARLNGRISMVYGCQIDQCDPTTCCCVVDVPATAAANGYMAESDGVDWYLTRAGEGE